MSFREQIDSVRTSFLADIDPFPEDQPNIDKLHSKFLGRKGQVARLFNQLSTAPKEELPDLGK